MPACPPRVRDRQVPRGSPVHENDQQSVGACIRMPCDSSENPQERLDQASVAELQSLFAEISGSWSELVKSVRALKEEVAPQEPAPGGAREEETVEVLATLPRRSAESVPEPCLQQGTAPEDDSRGTDVTRRLNGLLAKVRARLDSARRQAPTPQDSAEEEKSPSAGGDL